jgi:LmbE family N-acetylglucosaminyl deacetylase
MKISETLPNGKFRCIFYKGLGSFLLLLVIMLTSSIKAYTQNNKLNVIIIGAHPDDAEDMAGGVAAKWVKAGANVLMVSLTNGDAGHQTIPAEQLAKIRREEARKAGLVIGVKYITLDNHDGKLMPTYENREQVIRLIREQKADIVISPRPYDYHPDHRNTGQLVLDAAYMVTVPKIVPDVPILTKNPLFLWASDRFEHPEPFKDDVAIDIGDEIETKIDMFDKHVSQFYEWLPFNTGELDQVPKDPAARRKWLGDKYKKESNGAFLYRDKLVELYGKEAASMIKYVEAFEDSQYGALLTKENLTYYFPFLKPVNN